MADVNANIGVNIDSTQALAQLKALQRQISEFHMSVSKSSEAAALAQKSLQKNLVSSINSIGAFSAELRTVKTTAESFTSALENNKLSMREYFRYAGASTKTFGKAFKSEFDTIGKVAEERVKTLQTQYIKMGRDANGAMKAIAVRPLVLDMDSLATKTQIAAQKQAIFNQLMKQGSTNLLNFGKNTQWAGRQLMVGFTLPLAAFGSTAAKAFQQLETEVIKFKKVYGDLGTTQAETDQALTNIKSLADGYTRYGVEVSKTVGLASQAAAAGFQGADLMAQTDAATKLAVLGQIDQQQALETTISLQNAFKISSGELATTIDFLNAVENQTVTSLDDITIAIPKVAPVIQQLGGDVKDLAFFLTAMKEGGVNASEGANALKSGLASLINPTTKAKEMLGSLGININEIVTKNKGNLKATVVEFAQALNGLDPLARARAIETMFGKFQFARISTLLSNVVQTGNQAATVLGLAGESAGNLADLTSKELGITAESALVKFQGSMAKLKASLAPVGEVFMKAFVPVLDFFSKILDKFNGLSDGTKKFVAITAGVIGGLGPILLMTFGLLANGLANIMKLFMTLRTGYQRLTGQSQNLGEQTQYLTTEQLDAAAAAHSLEQSHARLTQQFTAEASQVNRLRIAYQEALAAGASFASLNPGMMRTPRKFATGGIFKGPGNGTSDSIPAMVSNGEAIIPAKTVQKNPALVAGLISGKIGRFADGFIPMYAEYAARMQDPTQNMRQQAGTTGLGHVLAPLAARIAEGRGISLSQKSIASGNIDGIVSEFSGITQAFVDRVNANYETTYKDITDTSERFKLAWNKAGKEVEKSVNEIASDVDRGVLRKTFGLDEDIYSTIPTAARNAGETTPTRARQGAFKRGKYGIRSYTALRPAFKSIYERITGESGKDLQFGHVNEPIQAEIAKLQQDPMASSSVRRAAAVMEGKVLESTAKASKAAKDAVKKVATEISTAIDSAKTVVAKNAYGLGETAVNSLARGAKTASPSQASRQTAKNIIEGLRMELAAGQGTISVAGTSVGKIAVDSIDAGVTTETAVKKPGIVSRLRGLTSTIGTGRLASVAGTLASPKVGIGLSSALMVGSMMPGAAGQISNTLAQIGFFGQALMMLPGPLKLAAVAAGGLYLAHKLVSAAAERARLKIEGLGDIANLTGKKLKNLDNYFGITPTTSPFEQGAIANPLAPSQQSEVQKLRESDLFKKDFKTEINTLKGASNQEASTALTSLSVKLAGRGYAKDQIQTILNALQQESGKTALDLKFESIDLTTKEGQAGFAKSANNATKKLQEAMTKGMSTIKVDTLKDVWDEKSGMKVALYKNVAVFTDEAKKQANLASQSFTAMITGISGQLANGKINADQFRAAFDGISNSILKMPKAQGLYLIDTLMRSLPENLRQTARGLNDVKDQMMILEAQALGMTNIPGLIEALDVAANGFGPDQARAQQRIDAFKKEMQSRGKALQELAKVGTGGTGTSGTGTDTLSKEAKLTIARLQKELDALKTKRDIIKDTNAELKRQYDQQQKLMQLQQQSVQEKISGNYIGAAIIEQQKSQAVSEFNKETTSIALDKKITALENRISGLQAGERVTAAEKALAKAKGYATGGLIRGPGTSMSDSIRARVGFANGGEINLSNGEYVMRAASVRQYGVGFMNAVNSGSATSSSIGGSTVYNIDMTIHGGASNPNEIADQVIKKLNMVANKNNKNNKVVF